MEVYLVILILRYEIDSFQCPFIPIFFPYPQGQAQLMLPCRGSNTPSIPILSQIIPYLKVIFLFGTLPSSSLSNNKTPFYSFIALEPTIILYVIEWWSCHFWEVDKPYSKPFHFLTATVLINRPSNSSTMRLCK